MWGKAADLICYSNHACGRSLISCPNRRPFKQLFTSLLTSNESFEGRFTFLNSSMLSLRRYTTLSSLFALPILKASLLYSSTAADISATRRPCIEPPRHCCVLHSQSYSDFQTAYLGEKTDFVIAVGDEWIFVISFSQGLRSIREGHPRSDHIGCSIKAFVSVLHTGIQCHSNTQTLTSVETSILVLSSPEGLYRASAS